MPYDVAVIGAGVVGCAVARELSRYRVSAVVVEAGADVSFGTTKANSGIVHAGFHSTPGTLEARLCVRGNRLYGRIAAELDVPFKRNGLVMVARDSGEMARLHDFLEQGKENGLTDLEIIGRDELLRLEPNLSPELQGALLAPGGGIVAPFELAMAMAENARRNGVEFLLDSAVTSMKATGEGILLTAGGRTLAAGFVVNATGLQASAVAGLMGDDSFVIRPRKGQEYLLDRRLEGLVKRTIFPLPTAISKGILVIPTVEGNIMLGPTAEDDELPGDTGTTREGWEEIRAQVSALVPGIDERDLIASFAGIRAGSDRGDFVIAPSPADRRLINAAGIESPGLTAAPAIAEEVRELLREEGLTLQTKPDFCPERKVVRFRGLSPDEKDLMIEEDPAYGRIVCRCETVTEAEIRRAVRAGATTVDGVKFRTRAGMGRCQGGFCTPRVVEIIADELGVDPLEVTKRGGGSLLLAGRIRESRRTGAAS